MTIRPDSPVPVFQQIADGIRSAVAAGVYRAGDIIPSVRVQAIALLVNPNTVQRAYQELERDGLIVARKGTGMVVAPRSRAAAQNGVEESVRQSLRDAITSARRAGVDRATVDKWYREAWSRRTQEGEGSSTS
jgi:GntR family transcriptional regulator